MVENILKINFNLSKGSSLLQKNDAFQSISHQFVIFQKNIDNLAIEYYI